VAGTFQLANGFANAHTIWSSGATTTNTIQGLPQFRPRSSSRLHGDQHDLLDARLWRGHGECSERILPGAGVAHFAGSTQTVTSSSIVNADIAASTIDLTAKVTECSICEWRNGSQ